MNDETTIRLDLTESEASLIKTLIGRCNGYKAELLGCQSGDPYAIYKALCDIDVNARTERDLEIEISE